MGFLSPKNYVRGGATRWLERWSLELGTCCPSLGIVTPGLPSHCGEAAARWKTPMVSMYLLAWMNCWGYWQGEMAQGTEKHVSGPDRSSLLQKLPAKSIFAPCRCCLSVRQAIATAFWHSWKCRSSSVMGNSSPSPRDRASLWGWGTLLRVRIRITPGEGNQGHVWCYSRHSPGPKAENSIFSCGWVA